MKLRIETSSIVTWETYPCFAIGEITSMGTRTPKPWLSTVGGGTWSYQPPPSSQITTIAVSDHPGEACILAIVSVSQFNPTKAEPDPGCIECTGPGCTKVTDGNVLLSS